MSILIVEDEPAIAKVLCQQLQSFGIAIESITIAKTCEEGLRTYQQNTFELVLFSAPLINWQVQLEFTRKPLRGALILTLTREQDFGKSQAIPYTNTLMKPFIEQEIRMKLLPYLSTASV